MQIAAAEVFELRIPFTSGILVGIGETWDERIDTLLAMGDLHRRFGHIQEVIVQPFRPHAATPWNPSPRMRSFQRPPPSGAMPRCRVSETPCASRRSSSGSLPRRS